MSETTHVCTSCEESKVRILLKYKLREGRWKQPVHVDDKGRQWNYNQCPDCKYQTNKNTMKRYEAPKAARKCQHCKKPLVINYFYHPECLKAKEDQVGYTGDEYV